MLGHEEGGLVAGTAGAIAHQLGLQIASALVAVGMVSILISAKPKKRKEYVELTTVTVVTVAFSGALFLGGMLLFAKFLGRMGYFIASDN